MSEANVTLGLWTKCIPSLKATYSAVAPLQGADSLRCLPRVPLRCTLGFICLSPLATGSHRFRSTKSGLHISDEDLPINPTRQKAAVNNQDFPGHITRRIRRQKNCRTG